MRRTAAVFIALVLAVPVAAQKIKVTTESVETLIVCFWAAPVAVNARVVVAMRAAAMRRMGIPGSLGGRWPFHYTPGAESSGQGQGAAAPKQ